MKSVLAQIDERLNNIYRMYTDDKKVKYLSSKSTFEMLFLLLQNKKLLLEEIERAKTNKGD